MCANSRSAVRDFLPKMANQIVVSTVMVLSACVNRNSQSHPPSRPAPVSVALAYALSCINALHEHVRLNRIARHIVIPHRLRLYSHRVNSQACPPCLPPLRRVFT